MIKKIALDNFVLNYQYLISSFLNQFCSFMNIEMFIHKIINAYSFYYNSTKTQNLINLINFLNECIIQIYVYFKEIKFSNPIHSTLKKFYNKLLIEEKFKINYIEDILSLFEDECPHEEDIKYVKNLIQYRKKNKTIIKRKQNRIMTPRDNIYYLFHKKKKDNNKFNVLDYREIDISNQLTYISKIYFNNIEIKEILNSKFSKINKEIDSPNIIKLIRNSNNLTNFVIENILSEKNVTNRARIIEQWIKICETLRINKNYNDCVPINLALSSFFISSLEKTWKKVKIEYKNIFLNLKHFCSISENFKILRDNTKNCKDSPYIPFLGILLKDISSYDEKFKYIINDKFIDFYKIELVENIIDEFFNFKNFAFNIIPINSLEFFKDIKCKSEQELEELYNELNKK